MQNKGQKALSLSVRSSLIKSLLFLIFSGLLLLLGLSLTSCQNDKIKADRVEVSICYTDDDWHSKEKRIDNKSDFDLFVNDSFLLTAEVFPDTLANKNVKYSSSNPNVASVDKSGKLLIKSEGVTTITCSSVYGGNSLSFKINSTEHLEGVEFKSNKYSQYIKNLDSNEYVLNQLVSRVIELEVDDEIPLAWSTTPKNVSSLCKKELFCKQIYNNRLMDTSVASVDSSGILRANQVGKCYLLINATESIMNPSLIDDYLDSKIEAQDIVAVDVIQTPVMGISINKTNLSLQIGDTETLIATVLPQNATNKNITWSSSNTSVASVNQSGLVTAKGIGQAVITAKTQDGGKIISCNIQVSPVPVESITLSKSTLELELNEQHTLSAIILPKNATNKSVTWSSSNESVVTVNQSGLITAKEVGGATITTATKDGGFVASCDVNVVVSVSNIILDKTDLEIYIDDTKNLIPTIMPENAINKNIFWSSSNENVATVNQQGVIVAKELGETFVTVTTEDGGYTASCKVNVLPYPLLKFESDSEFSITSRGGNGGKTWNGELYYLTSYSAGEWLEWDGKTLNAELSNGKYVICMRGLNNSSINERVCYKQDKKWYIEGENVTCSGDIRSLLNYKNVENTEMAEYCFAYLFCDNSSLISAPSLPTTVLSANCYYGMFEGCTSLMSAPSLPATTLADGCYYEMFSFCSSLTSPPDLPATTLAENCYCGMFEGCTSLTQAPVLPATVLAKNCYRGMFDYCTSLTQAPALPATTLADGCYQAMFHNCQLLTQAPALPATTLAKSCYEFMFVNCISLIYLPALPADQLEERCYWGMFAYCKSLKLSKTRTSLYKYSWTIGSKYADGALTAMFESAGTPGATSGITLYSAYSIIHP